MVRIYKSTNNPAHGSIWYFFFSSSHPVLLFVMSEAHTVVLIKTS